MLLLTSVRASRSCQSFPGVPFRPIHVEITLGPDRGLAGSRDAYPGIVLELPGDERVAHKDLPRFPVTENAMRSRCIAWKGSYLDCENSAPKSPCMQMINVQNARKTASSSWSASSSCLDLDLGQSTFQFQNLPRPVLWL